MSLFPKYTPAKPAKAAKVESTLASLATLAAPADQDILFNQSIPEPQWQHHFCSACGDFNQLRGECPRSLDDCLLTRIQNAEGDPDKLTDMEIGKGIAAEQIISQWNDSGEPIAGLFRQPLWFILMAEYFDNEVA